MLRLSPGSVLRDHFWKGLGDHVGCQGSNSDALCVGKEPYLSDYFLDPAFLLKRSQTQSCGLKERAKGQSTHFDEGGPGFNP